MYSRHYGEHGAPSTNIEGQGEAQQGASSQSRPEGEEPQILWGPQKIIKNAAAPASSLSAVIIIYLLYHALGGAQLLLFCYSLTGTSQYETKKPNSSQINQAKVYYTRSMPTCRVCMLSTKYCSIHSYDAQMTCDIKK